ncbi:hypothetical protein B0T21DRAFT_452023 [Apiosordaria backusii]|uniref:Uncharacterized protein n=1 Tax=Apiosordaria backusii TaxID=314023 RepID=A0AA40BDR8_9PEZI|nr:hypothetical protein B0T21DRAFT_452023 [Apiosordaria backusii]
MGHRRVCCYCHLLWASSRPERPLIGQISVPIKSISAPRGVFRSLPFLWLKASDDRGQQPGNQLRTKCPRFSSTQPRRSFVFYPIRNRPLQRQQPTMTTPRPPAESNHHQIGDRMSTRFSSPSSDQTLFSANASRRPSSSCPSPNPPSPPSPPSGLLFQAPQLPSTYSLANLSPEEIGWNWETSSLGRSPVPSFLTAPTNNATPVERYVHIPQRHEIVSLSIDTRSQASLVAFSAHNQQLLQTQQSPPVASGLWDGRQQNDLLASLTERAATLPGSSYQPQELVLSSPSWSSTSTVCSLSTAVDDDAEDDELDIDSEIIRLKLGEIKRQRERTRPRAFRPARMKRRVARRNARRAGGSKAEVVKSPGKGLERSSPVS